LASSNASRGPSPAARWGCGQHHGEQAVNQQGAQGGDAERQPPPYWPRGQRQQHHAGAAGRIEQGHAAVAGVQLALGEHNQLRVDGGRDQVDEGHHGRDVAQHRVAQDIAQALDDLLADGSPPFGVPGALQDVAISPSMPSEARKEAASAHSTCWTGATVMSRPASNGPATWAAE
jgi:hypothetical protein